MRMLLFCAALLFPSLAIAQQVNRTSYSAGTATTGGCTGPTNSTSSTVGACLALGDTSSVWINDCWSNGVLSLTSYGSNNCAPSSASSMSIAGANIAGTSLNQSYCNVGSNPASYNTFTCSAATPAPAQNIRVYIFATLAGATNCSGNPTITQDVPAGVCTQIQGTGTPIPNGPPNPPLYVLGNCANGLVTSVIYNTSNCAVTFDNTGAIITSVSASGPWGQVNATSAAGKAINAAGASCSLPNPQAYFAYTCITPTSAPGTTTAPPTATPTPTPTPGNGTTSPPTKSAAASVTAGAATFLALVIAAVANLL